MAIHPVFSTDYSKLIYISSDEFLSHSGNYELKVIDWKNKTTKTIIKKFINYPQVKI